MIFFNNTTLKLRNSDSGNSSNMPNIIEEIRKNSNIRFKIFEKERYIFFISPSAWYLVSAEEY